MSRACVVFAEDGMMNDGGRHVCFWVSNYQVLSTNNKVKRTTNVSRQIAQAYDNETTPSAFKPLASRFLSIYGPQTLGNTVCQSAVEDQGQNSSVILKGGLDMKRLLVLILVWTLLVVTGTLVSADGKTRVKDNEVIKSQFVMNTRHTVSNITEAK